MKKSIFTWTLMAILANISWADDQYIVSQQPSITVLPVFQAWSDEDYNHYYETIAPITIYYPVNRSVSVMLMTNMVSAAGDYLYRLRGLSDTQLSANYYYEPLKLIFSLGLNIPSGMKEFDFDGFRTSALISQNYLNFKVPNLGQGFNVSPGVSWAYMLNDRFAIGLGLSYQYKGGYKPLVYMKESYSPGSELLLTTGFDYKLNETTTISTDFLYISYGKDAYGEDEVFESGNMMVANLRFRKYINYDEISFFVRYRSKTKNSSYSFLLQEWQEEQKKSTPDQVEFSGKYRRRMSSRSYTSFVLELKNFERTYSYPQIDYRAIGLVHEIMLTPQLVIPFRFKFQQTVFETQSSLLGYEMGAGISLRF